MAGRALHSARGRARRRSGVPPRACAAGMPQRLSGMPKSRSVRLGHAAVDAHAPGCPAPRHTVGARPLNAAWACGHPRRSCVLPMGCARECRRGPLPR
eukprot:145573-Chlamydomonas_euryale.AAC.5